MHIMMFKVRTMWPRRSELDTGPSAVVDALVKSSINTFWSSSTVLLWSLFLAAEACSHAVPFHS
jgi:hypothetical protein